MNDCEDDRLAHALLDVQRLEEERDMLAFENKQLANFIFWNDPTLTNEDISDIIYGNVDVWKRFKHAGFVECMNAIKSLPTIAEEEV